jgi:hypothetical protein
MSGEVRRTTKPLEYTGKTREKSMKNSMKLALAAVAFAAVTTAQAQYTGNNDELLLGFTTASSTGDLIIDLGTFSSITPGDLNNSGHTGFANDAALQTELNSLYGSMNSLIFGAVGGHAVNAVNAGIYSTGPRPTGSQTQNNTIGIVIGDVDSMGNAVTTGNQAIVNPSFATGQSVTENMHNSTSSATIETDWNINVTSRTSATFANGATQFLTENLYHSANGASTLVGTLTLGSDGSLVFAAVPEPTTFGLLGGLGVLALALRRQFARN